MASFNKNGFIGTTSTSLINVTTGNGTLAQLWDAIDDVDVAAASSVGQVHSIHNNRALTINSGVILNMSAGDTLQWDTKTSNNINLTINPGSTFTATDNCIIDCDVNNGNYTYIYTYGNISFVASSGNEMIIRRYYGFRLFPRGNTVVMDYVDFEDPSSYSTSNMCLWFEDSMYLKPEGWSFTNIRYQNRTASGFIAYFDGGDWTSVIFDNITTDNTRYGINAVEGGSSHKMTNSTFNNVYSEWRMKGMGSGTYMKSQYDRADSFKTTDQQQKYTFDNCTFFNNYYSSSTERCFSYGAAGAIVKFKNCDFTGLSPGDPSRYGIYGIYHSSYLFQGTNNFTDVTDNLLFSSSHRCGYYDVFELNLLVKDSNGDVLEGATVNVSQKEGHESHNFKTTEDQGGYNVIDCFKDPPVFVYREITSNTPAYDYWSNGTGSQIHVITISHPDYQVDTREVVFDQDRTIVAQLTANAVGTTNIHGSTFYDSTIY